MNPEDTYISPAVITARPAEQDLARIQAAHSDIVKGIANQSMKVAQFNQAREQQTAAENAARLESDRQMRTEQNLSEQKKMELNLKMQELQLKQQALNQPYQS